MPPSDLQIACWAYDLYWQPDKFDKIIDVAGIYSGIKYFPDCTLVIDRGSTTPEDWERDLKSITMVQTPYGGVGDGFNEGMNESDSAIIPLVDMLKPVILSGHSLGASHADRRAAAWNKIIEASLDLVKFGSPQTGDIALRESLKGVSIRSYRNGDDQVCNFPLAIPGQSFMQTCDFIPIYCEPINLDPWVSFKFHHEQLYCGAMARAFA